MPDHADPSRSFDRLSRQVKRAGVTMLGHGTVGRGVVKVLAGRGRTLREKLGLQLDLRHVVVRDSSRHQDAAGLPLITDAAAAIDDPQVTVVLELIGGTGDARQHVLRALRAGKHVVTANKALLAAHGPELFSVAREHGVSLAFEASCAGGIPIVGALLGGLLANRVDALVGILNGTSNVILSAMTDAGQSYADALKDAQDAGFAEADPSLDVNGGDAAQKLSILAGLAFGEHVPPGKVHTEGIDRLDPQDIAFAGELGYVVKLLATAERDQDGRCSLSVFPGLLPTGDAMADVKGPFNAVATYGDALGRALFVGRGAGMLPTASAVVADLVAVANGTYPLAFSQLGTLPDLAGPADVLPFEQTSHRYYLRITARDVPGVLAGVTRCLGDAGISLSGLTQHEPTEDAAGEWVPVIVTTHRARELSMQQAVAAIDNLAGVKPSSTVLRIIDMPSESDA
ncbi:MAG: homoserine dehydrogenase [Planctomycetota bacterium]